VLSAASRPEVVEAVRNIHIALQDAIDLHKPICITSGRCCRFDEFGHRLFVTTMELGTFVGGLTEVEQGHDSTELAEVLSGSAGGRCPFQKDKLCSVHTIRPFGCRVFFCDATATDWQHQQYARFHAELKRLHDEMRIPYFYVEWREAMGIVGASRSSD
jgi:Fe-S-cluster containining protein